MKRTFIAIKTTISQETTDLLNSIRFELQDENVLKGTYLINYNIKPRDIVDIINNENLVEFCKSKGISIFPCMGVIFPFSLNIFGSSIIRQS